MDKQKTEAKTPGRFRVSVKDVGGVQDVDLVLETCRLNVLLGDSGAGKTSVINALSALFSGDLSKIEVRDGAKIGRVQVDTVGGDTRVVTVPSRGKARTEGGRSPLPVSKLDVISRLITGGNRKGLDAKNRERLDSLAEMLRPALTDEAVEVLTEKDPELSEWLRQKVADGELTGLLEGADALQKEIQRRRREREATAGATALQEKGQLQQVKALRDRMLSELGKHDPVGTPDPEGTAKAADLLLRQLGKDEAKAEQRRQAEEHVSAIRAAKTQRPDEAAAERKVRELEADLLGRKRAVADVQAKIAELQQALAAEEAHLAGVQKAGKEALAVWRDAQRDAKDWDAQQEQLLRPIEGPTEEDVEAVRVQHQQAVAVATWHRLSADLAEAQAQADDAAQRSADAAQREKELSARNKAVPERVADVLSDLGAGGFTVVDGMLAYKLDGGEPRDYETRLSPGQKSIAAIQLGSILWGGFVEVPPDVYWGVLDDAGRAWVREFAESRPDLLVVVEHATSGPVRLEEEPLPAIDDLPEWEGGTA